MFRCPQFQRISLLKTLVTGGQSRKEPAARCVTVNDFVVPCIMMHAFTAGWFSQHQTRQSAQSSILAD